MLRQIAKIIKIKMLHKKDVKNVKVKRIEAYQIVEGRLVWVFQKIAKNDDRYYYSNNI